MLDHPHENHSLNLKQLACNKSTSSLISFLRYCKEIANLLFWLIWACLATPTWNDTITFMKPSTFISMEKINFNLHVFLDILQKYFKPVVLGTLGMFGYVYPKWYYHLIENFHVYLQAKNQLHHSCFYGYIAKVCKLILGTFGMPGYTHPKW